AAVGLRRVARLAAAEGIERVGRLDAVRAGEAFVTELRRLDELLARVAVGAAAVVGAVVRLAVLVRASARAVNGAIRFVVRALCGDLGAAVLADDALGLVVGAATAGQAARLTGTVGRSAHRGLTVGAREAPAEVIHQTQTGLALEALRLEI